MGLDNKNYDFIMVIQYRKTDIWDAAVRGGAEAGGAIHRITECSQNLREYERNN
jgi:hypothetical protein